jgi:CDP-diacylglycerol--glycerol-3-phosphate 3-phosphatidyltransferase
MKGLYGIKPWFVRRLRRVEDKLVARRVSPAAITWSAVAVSVLAGCALAGGGITRNYTWWFLVPPLAVVRLALNALDGSVARRTDRASHSGAVVNEIADRAADTAFMVPAAFAVEPALAVGATAAAYLTSLTGVMGSATGTGRLTGGPMGKADRVALIALGAVAGAASASPEPLAIALVVVVAGCVVTVVTRIRVLVSEEPGPDA